MRKLTLNEFIEKANKVHKGKYDYSLVVYINNSTRVEIVCPLHSTFKQTPGSHLFKTGCPGCSNNKKLTTREFVERAISVHGEKYDYSQTVYKNAFKTIEVICPVHGVFYPTPNNHLNGETGCPICNLSKGELKIRNYLEERKINFIEEYKFENCKKLNSLPFDFYLPLHNVCIEYDGEQHFKPIKFFGGKKMFKVIKENDLIKTNYCREEKIVLVRVSYLDYEKTEEILNNLLIGF